MFTHLHVHSHYSLLQSTAKIEDLVRTAKAKGMTHLALTDAGVLYGCIDFYRECKKNNITPIVGMEAFIAPNGRLQKRAHIDEERLTITLLAKNIDGYRSLVALSTLAHLEGYYYRPRIDDELLEQYNAGLIALSGDYWGVIPDAIRKNKTEETITKYQKMFGAKNFFLEVQTKPGIPDQQRLNAVIFALGEKHGVGVVATGDVHYINKDDAEAQDILMCIGKKKKLSDTHRFSMRGEDYSLKGEEDMRAMFADHPEAVDLSNAIAEQCALELPLDEILLPHFATPNNKTADEYLREVTLTGTPRRYGTTYDEASQEIRDRTEYELSVITKMGYASYFLIVQDFIVWAKGQGIIVGPGRGSAAGSIVSYLLGITELDPLAYNLVFERFLNPERISMPDIDIDFADSRRDEVLRYVEKKYGKDHVAQIITFGTMAARAALRDVGRVMDLSYTYCDRIAKMIPMFTTLDDALRKNPELKTTYDNEPDAKTLIDNARRLEGVARHASIHACGVVIAKDPLIELVPTQHAPQVDDVIITQYDMRVVEKLGLLKMDFLGLANLTIIEKALAIIKALHNTTIDINNLPLDDKKTFALFRKGNTTGVFQFESAGMKRHLRQLKPTQFEDIIAMVALYRPGPMDLIPSFVARKQGKERIAYLHPKLKPILDNTYGIAVYQEQVLEMARELAGFSYAEADVLRKAVGKKIIDLLAEQKVKFIKGCVAQGHSRQLGEELFSFIEPFARYGFNRAHATCYALISFQTAYLKAHYPVAFMAALLTSDQHNTDRVTIEVEECRNMGIEVLPPDINESVGVFTVVSESLRDGIPRIRFGLHAIKNVGDGVVEEIIAERKTSGAFTDIEDFLRRVPSKNLNKKSLEAFTKCGALDSLGDRSTFLASIDQLLAFHKKNAMQEKSGQAGLFASMENEPTFHLQLMKVEPAPKSIRLRWEKELLGLYVSEHPFSEFGELLPANIVPCAEARQAKKRNVVMAGVVIGVKKILTRKGEQMLFAKIEDGTGCIEVLVFPSLLQATGQAVWDDGSVVALLGNLNDKDGELKLLASDVRALTPENAKEVFAGLGQEQTPTKKKIFTLTVDEDEKNAVLEISSQTKRELLHSLKILFEKHSGYYTLFLALRNPSGRVNQVKTSATITPSEELQKALEELLNPDPYDF